MPDIFGISSHRLNEAVFNQTDKVADSLVHEEMSTAKKWLIGIFTLGIGAIVIECREHAERERAKQMAQSVLNLKTELRALPPDQEASFSIKMLDHEVTVVQGADNKLSVVLPDKRLELNFDARELTRRLENDIVSHPDFYGKEKALYEINRARALGPENSARCRELSLKAICANSNLTEADFSAVTNQHISYAAEMAIEQRLNGSDYLANLIAPLSNRDLINSVDCQELIERFDRALAERPEQVRSRVQLNASDRNAPAPQSNQTDAYRQLAADLIYSEETWIHDQNVNAPGERLRYCLNKHADTVAELLNHPEILQDLPLSEDQRNMIELARSAMQTLYADGEVSGAQVQEFADNLPAESLAYLEQQIDAQVNVLFDRVQQEVCSHLSELTNPGTQSNNTVQTEPQAPEATAAQSAPQQTADAEQSTAPGATVSETEPESDRKKLERMMSSSGLDLNSNGYGRFMQLVFSRYFSSVDALDKRSMLASLLRGSDENPSIGQQAGAFLKGAGPIMQKMLQGFNTDAVNPEFAQAIADMKSNLAPIPDKIVQAYLLSMVENSHGAIQSIEVVRSLGAASVGQALLCRVSYAGNPPEEMPGTRECVIKLLRPDVQNRARREQDVFKQAAAEVPGMAVTFDGQLKRIMQELDLTVEAENIKAGQIYSQMGDNKVKSMQLSPLCPPSQNILMLEKAPGATVDRFMQQMRQELEDIIAPLCERNEDGSIKRDNATGRPVMLNNSKPEQIFEVQRQLLALYEKAKDCQSQLVSLSRIWVAEGIYRDGFYHGDLHAGNIMYDPQEGLTVIDFGNATALTSEQQGQITLMVAAAAVGDTPRFLSSFRDLLSPEGKQAFDAHRAEAEAKVGEIMALGKIPESGYRIAVALTELQKLGIEVPAPVFNFSQCQVRLQGAVDSANQFLADISATMVDACNSIHSMYTISPNLLGNFMRNATSVNQIEIAFATYVNQMTSPLQGFKEDLRRIMPFANDPRLGAGAWRDVHYAHSASFKDAVDHYNELKQRYNVYTDSENSSSVRQTLTPEQQAELAASLNEVVEIGYKCEIDYVNNNIDIFRKMEAVFAHKPHDFCIAMAEVINDNLHSSLSRLGVINAMRYWRQFA